MHGGLFTKDDVTLDDIRKIDRNREPPEDGTVYSSDFCVVILCLFAFLYNF